MTSPTRRATNTTWRWHEVNEVALRQFEYGVQAAVSNRLGRVVESEAFRDRFSNMVTCAFTTKIAGETLEVKEATFPADWWQAVKERWFPVWVKERWPVRYASIRIEARALYPKISLPREQFESVIVYDETRFNGHEDGS